MDDFENLWKEEEIKEDEEVEEETPEYQIKQAVSKYNILCDLLGFYYHAKHGESMADIFAPDTGRIEFTLEDASQKRTQK